MRGQSREVSNADARDRACDAGGGASGGDCPHPSVLIGIVTFARMLALAAASIALAFIPHRQTRNAARAAQPDVDF